MGVPRKFVRVDAVSAAADHVGWPLSRPLQWLQVSGGRRALKITSFDTKWAALSPQAPVAIAVVSVRIRIAQPELVLLSCLT